MSRSSQDQGHDAT